MAITNINTRFLPEYNTRPVSVSVYVGVKLEVGFGLKETQVVLLPYKDVKGL